MALSPIVAQAILQQRAPDIVGQFQAGRQIRQEEEAAQRQKQAQQLTGQFLQQRLGGGPLSELANVDPQQAAGLAQAFGIPVTEPQRLKSLAQNVQIARGIAETDPERAAQFVQQFKQSLNIQGIDTSRIDEFLIDIRNDPIGAVEDLETVGRGFERAGLVQALERPEPTGRKPEDIQKQVNVLRKSIDAELKAFNQVEQANNRVRRVGDKATPASDLALIFNFMKMLDPGSVVRESEFKTAEDAKAWLVRSEEAGVPIPAPIANFVRRAQEGTLLEDTQRQDFLNQASSLFDAARESADMQLERILQRADVDEIKRKRVIGGASLGALRKRQAGREQQPAAQPAPRTLEQLTQQDLSQLSDEELAQLAGGQ